MVSSPDQESSQQTAVIVFNLSCNKEHRFEGWFASSEAFEHQQAQGLLTCPSCGSADVHKLPAAPYVQTSGRRENSRDTPASSPSTTPAETKTPLPTASSPQAMLSSLMEALQTYVAQSEDVGERFPEEARLIHAGEVEARAIKGVASLDEMAALLEEGIQVLPVPPAKEDMH